MPERIRLDSLTALRFFAAAMVVVTHSAGLFHFLAKPAIMDLPLAQGVSFFFVLSGFILTYNYPKLNGVENTLKFWRARLARIWPAHAFALFLGLFVFALKPLAACGVPLYQNLLAHIFMVHGWILQGQFYFSFNPPSWSISTEFAFYLLFPLLIWKHEKNWWMKLLLGAMIVVGFIWYGTGANLPETGDPTRVSAHALMYINPLVRVFEFILGMSCATFWTRIRNKKISPILLTVLEIACLATIAAYVANIFHLVEPLRATSMGRLIRFWLLYDGNCFAFAGLIVVCALQEGFISRLLSNKVFVWLGEISFSVYLLHMMVLLLFTQNLHRFATVNSPILFTVYCAILIAASASDLHFH